MSNVRKFKVRSKISTVGLGGGGITVSDAVKRANVAVDELRPPSLDLVDVSLAEIESRFGASAAPTRAQEPLEDLYKLSSRIIDSSIGLPNSGIDHAARALCDLVDVSLEKGVRDWEAIDVHVETLKLLRSSGQAFTQAQRDSVLGGLKKVTLKRVGDTGAPAA